MDQPAELNETQSSDPINAEAAAQFASLDQSTTAGAQQPLNEPEVLNAENCTPQEAIAGLIQLCLVPAASMNMQRTLLVWDDETIQRVAAQTVKVMQKSAWGRKILDFLTTGLGVEEMALIMTVIGLIIPTMMAVRMDLDELRAKQAAAVKEATPA